MKKMLALLLSLISVISMMTVVSASDTTVTPTLLQYEDFWYGAARYLSGFSSTGAAGKADEAKGFSSGWQDFDYTDTGSGTGVPVTYNHWYVGGDQTAAYIETRKKDKKRVYREVDANKAVDMTVADKTRYIVSWDTQVTAGVSLTANQGAMIGMKQDNTNLKPRFGFNNDMKLFLITGNSGGVKSGTTTYEQGTNYTIVMEMTANPAGTEDTIKMKAYPKGTSSVGAWDLEYAKDGETLKQEVFALNVNMTANPASGEYVRFANYRVESLDAAAISAVEAAEAKIDAVKDAAEGYELNNAVAAAEAAVNSFAASTTKTLLQDQLDAALVGKTYDKLYNVELLQYEDFAYDQLGSIQMQSLKEFDDSETMADTARGFTTGWNFGPGETWVNWNAVRNAGETYITPATDDAGKISRTVDADKAIKTSANGSGYYLVTWKQYVPADLDDDNGHSLGFLFNGSNVKPRFGVAVDNGSIKPYSVISKVVRGEQELVGNKWYDAVLLINENTTDGTWKYKLTASDTPADYESWDVAINYHQPFTQTVLGMQALSNTTVGETKFADYRVVKVNTEDDAINYLNLRELIEKAYAATIAVTDDTTAAGAAAAVDAVEAKMTLMQDSNEKSAIAAELAAMDYYRENLILPVSKLTEDSSWDAFNNLQKKLNLMVESDLRHDTQAIFDGVAATCKFSQLRWQIDAVDGNGALTNGNCLVRGSVVNYDYFTNPAIIIAGYNGDTLAFAEIAYAGTADDFGFNKRVGNGFDRVKVIAIDDMNTIKPAAAAESFAK